MVAFQSVLQNLLKTLNAVGSDWILQSFGREDVQFETPRCKKILI
jgi:hypothetical protein